MGSKITPRGLGLQSTAKGLACLFFAGDPTPDRCRLHCAPLRPGNHLMSLIESYFAGKTAAISGAEVSGICAAGWGRDGLAKRGLVANRSWGILSFSAMWLWPREQGSAMIAFR